MRGLVERPNTWHSGPVCSRRTLVRHIDAGRLPAAERHVKRRVSRADAEALALQLLSSRVSFNADTSYWIGATGAAAILGPPRR